MSEYGSVGDNDEKNTRTDQLQHETSEKQGFRIRDCFKERVVESRCPIS